MNTLEIFRIENPDTNHGMWYDGDGNYNPFIFNLTEGVSRDLPMEHHIRYGFGGTRWFSGCQDVELMRHWFSKKDIEELLSSGYKLYKFESTEFVVEEFQVLFTRTGIITRTEIPSSTIWSD